MIGNATIDATDCTADPVMQFVGSFNTFYSIPNNYAVGDNRIKVNTAISDNAVRGDILFLTSDAGFTGVVDVELYNYASVNKGRFELG